MLTCVYADITYMYIYIYIYALLSSCGAWEGVPDALCV